ncbi:MAG: hypothetical protein WCQ57_14800 [Verrucomicrobiota bacterium]
MKIQVKFEGGRARKQASAPPPFGPEFSPEIIARIETLEVHGSELKDPGPDFCEFRAFDAVGHPIGTKRVNGY